MQLRRFELPKSESNLKAHMMGRVGLRIYRVAGLMDPAPKPTSELETLKKLTGIYMNDSTFFYKVPDMYALVIRPSNSDTLSADELQKITSWIIIHH